MPRSRQRSFDGFEHAGQVDKSAARTANELSEGMAASVKTNSFFMGCFPRQIP
jgi:hypothetical protein